jgi:hypothetical protein
MAEQKKLPSVEELMKNQEELRKRSTPAMVDRSNELLLKKNRLDADSLVSKTGVTGAAGKEMMKVSTPGDQTYKVNLGKNEVVNTAEPIKKLTGVTSIQKDAPQKIISGADFAAKTNEAAGRQVLNAGDDVAKTAASKGSSFMADKLKAGARMFGKGIGGKVAGVGAFLAGVSAALSGDNVNAADVAKSGLSTFLPPGAEQVQEGINAAAAPVQKRGAEFLQEQMDLQKKRDEEAARMGRK